MSPGTFPSSLRPLLRTATLILLVAVASCGEAVEQPVIAVAISQPEAVELARVNFARQGHRARLIGGQGQWLLADDAARARAFSSIDGIIGVVGHESSDRTLAVAGHYQESGLPLMIPTSTNQALSRLGPPAFMLSATDSVQAERIATAARTLGASAVALVYANDEYGLGLRDELLDDLAQLGIQVPEQIEVSSQADVDTRTEAMLARFTPDLIVVAGRTREAALAARTAARVHPGLKVLASDGAYVPSVLRRIAGEAIDNIYLTVQWHHQLPDSASREFVSGFESLAGRLPVASDALVYDGIALLLEAYEQAGPDWGAISLYLASLGDQHPPYPGITGPIAFHDHARRPYYLVTFSQGELHPVNQP